MNYKLEKFWNSFNISWVITNSEWTINLKSFEILNPENYAKVCNEWTINLKSFEITLLHGP